MLTRDALSSTVAHNLRYDNYWIDISPMITHSSTGRRCNGYVLTWCAMLFLMLQARLVRLQGEFSFLASFSWRATADNSLAVYQNVYKNR